MLLEEITKWIDEGSPVDIIYLDFQKAFDKVPHQRILLKLKVHGIGDGLNDCIEQWLTDRRLSVVVEGEGSNWKSVLTGVPQGSELGPLFLLIHINDLNDNITFITHLQIIQKCITFEICKCLQAGHENNNMGDTVLGTILRENHLRITISADMTTSEQCGIAASKGNQIIGVIMINISYKQKR